LEPKSSVSPDLGKLLKDLVEQLKLELPAGQVEITKDYLKDVQDKLNAFEPERFQRSFERLIEITGAKVKSKS
jgi:predicted secreted protein